MVQSNERLIAFGFIDKAEDATIYVGKHSIKIEGKTPQEKIKFLKDKRAELEKEDPKLADKFDEETERIADNDWIEYTKGQLLLTGYPKSMTMHRATLESWHQSVENYYYWVMNMLADQGFPVIEKITDVFTAAEHSSFYGAASQRLGLSQDKVAQYLATIGKMVKDLFQLVRELRWIDERLEIYRGAMGIDNDGKKTEKGSLVGPEQTLKALWVDLVDGVVGGQRTATNLYLMAQQVQFTVLPDLFYAIHPQKVDEVDKIVDDQAKEFNEPVRNALKRKLVQYVAWKNSTYDEMKVRRKFTIDYLRQHYQVIKMYMNWVKPYVRHIERLSGQQDLLNNPRLISAFESSLVEIEVLAKQRAANSDDYSCMLVTFEYHTKPSMQYPGDSGYHRGPIHVGTTKITWRSYAWTDKKIQSFMAMKSYEDLELITSIDKSLTSAMESLGTDLQNYLTEVEFGKKPEEKPKKQPLNLMEPFSSVAKGMAELLGAVMPKSKTQKSSLPPGKADGLARLLCYVNYNIFKKSNGMLSW